MLRFDIPYFREANCDNVPKWKVFKVRREKWENQHRRVSGVVGPSGYSRLSIQFGITLRGDEKFPFQIMNLIPPSRTSSI